VKARGKGRSEDGENYYVDTMSSELP
jgi:hypothetical protein